MADRTRRVRACVRGPSGQRSCPDDADSSPSGNDGTLFGCTFDAEGTPGWVDGGLTLAGGDYVDCGNPASLDLTSAVTVAAWVKVTGGAGHRHFNAVRKNSGKEMKTPLELIREKHPGTWRELTLFRPLLLDELAEKRVQSPDRGYDVRRYPS